MANWSMLPDDMLSIIANKLSPSVDFLRFGEVCKSWRSVAGRHQYPPYRQMPWLMLAEDKSERSSTCGFFSLSDGAIHDLPLPEARDTCVVGSTGGWLVLVSESQQVYMLNPMSRTRVDLPSLSTFPSYHDLQMRKYYGYLPRQRQTISLDKACLSPGRCTVVAIESHHFKLAFARPGDKSWTGIGEVDELGAFYDVLYFKGAFYALTNEGYVVICNFNHGGGGGAISVKVVAPARLNKGRCYGWSRFLVECSGNLLQVVRITTLKDLMVRTVRFDVFKWKSTQSKWEEVTRLGDHALFVGTKSTSMSVVVKNAVGCKANCIYFIDPNSKWIEETEGGGDICVFNMEDNTVVPYYPGYSRSRNFPPPIWIQPTLWL